jgi:hypothetical protein
VSERAFPLLSLQQKGNRCTHSVIYVDAERFAFVSQKDSHAVCRRHQTQNLNMDSIRHLLTLSAASAVASY